MGLPYIDPRGQMAVQNRSDDDLYQEISLIKPYVFFSSGFLVLGYMQDFVSSISIFFSGSLGRTGSF